MLLQGRLQHGSALPALIYSILEELSLHGLLFRSDCSWLFRSCFRCSYLATLSVSAVHRAVSGVLPSQFHSHPELAASCPPQDLLSRFGGREMPGSRDSPTLNQMLHFLL